MGIVFSFVLLLGLFARAKFGPQFLANVDTVAAIYIVRTFTPLVGVIISIAILAAAMSTLDGILVALSAIIANDFFLVLNEKRLKNYSAEERLKLALKIGRYSLIGLAIITLALGLGQHYYKQFSVAVFAQTWIYALFNATFIPLLFGMFIKNVNKWWVLSASGLSIMVHLIFRYGKLSLLTDADWVNPGLTAAYGLIASLALMGVFYLLAYLRRAKSIQ